MSIPAANKTEQDRIEFLGAVATDLEPRNLARSYLYAHCLSLSSAMTSSSGGTIVVTEYSAPSEASDGLTQYSGRWVAVSDNEVVASGDDAAFVTELARMAGIARPHVFFVEEIPENAVRLGL